MAAVAGLALSAATGHCTIATAGGPAVIPGTDPLAGATFVADMLNQSYSDGTGLVGTISSWVVSGDSLNPYAGGLTFIYQITETGADTVENFAANGFGFPQVDFETYATGAGGILPSAANGTVNSTSAYLTTGGTATFQLFVSGVGGGIQTGQTSYLLIVNTAATTYSGSSGGVQDGGSAYAGILAPVPEASTMIAGALLLLPFGASALRILRKTQMA